MEKTRREFVKLVGGAALGAGVILAGRGRAGAQAKPLKGVPAEPVKIGVLPILAGVGGVPGLAGLRGAEIWLEQANAAGGILGRKVEFYQEEETSPKDTVEKFQISAPRKPAMPGTPPTPARIGRTPIFTGSDGTPFSGLACAPALPRPARMKPAPRAAPPPTF